MARASSAVATVAPRLVRIAVACAPALVFAGTPWEDQEAKLDDPLLLQLFDLAGIYFRAFFAVPTSMTSPDGRPVNAVRGTLDILAKVITDCGPTRAIACLDLDWRPPLAQRFNFYQRAGGVDVFDDGAKVAPAIGMALNFQQVRPHIDQISRLSFLDGGGFVVHAAVEQVHAAEKVVNEGRVGVMVNLIRAADLLDAAFVHHCHTVGNFQGLFLVVSHEDGGDMHRPLELSQLLPHRLAEPGIEVGQRLIEEQRGRPDDDRPRHRHSLLLPA